MSSPAVPVRTGVVTAVLMVVSAKAGAGSSEGRFRARPSALAKSRLRAGFGEVQELFDKNGLPGIRNAFRQSVGQQRGVIRLRLQPSGSGDARV